MTFRFSHCIVALPRARKAQDNVEEECRERDPH